MPGRRVLITGGAGFVGSSLSLALAARHGDWEIVALDSLHRRGSELNLSRLRQAGVTFVHGDVRELEDLVAVGPFDAMVECSAEPSVLAGLDGSTAFVLRTNLFGAYHCLEAAARHHAQVIFLSTSRVYPMATLNALAFEETDTRFALLDNQAHAGASAHGVAETFPLDGPRTFYGASKLAAELLVAEYASTFGLATVVDRCGVIAGPWQMGKVDQGVFTHWILAHYFGHPVKYIGYGGAGKQVRDLMHVDDLIELIDDQLTRPAHWAGATVNVGGGRSGSLSLRETTALCEEITGRSLEIGSEEAERAGDVRIYLTDTRALERYTDWRPRLGPREILADIFEWVREHEQLVAGALGLEAVGVRG